MSHRCFRFKPSHQDLSAPQIAAIRRISPHSIAEIRRRAVANESVLDIPVFSGEWPASKAQVMALLHGIEAGTLPLAVFDAAISAGAPAQDSSPEQPLTVAQARQRLQVLRDIALEQDMHAQLEAGHIASPEEYTPLPEDEA
ncbi:hypothetical protein PMI14_02168 [Acidovorax sp. CF316]|uniref:hypothetical protein n=1 Tax=Acidovorax sp. CF316 TaxID=1144317 RepID=UPI00026BC2F4|nr:hypothetical protein [Acidovorax sp. CF316]EJE53094.1 hypothetical protein PMI14_02168 [Acidovorax sp. CF316]